MRPLKLKLLKTILIAVFVSLFFFSLEAFGLPVSYGGCTAADRTLYLTEPYMAGDDVIELQERLKEIGYYRGDISGVFDEKTDQAIKKIQKDCRINPTGKVGSATWNVLAAGITAPPVTTNPKKDVKPLGKMSILVDISKRTLILMEDGEPFKTFPCAVGKPSTPSPVGEWRIAHKGGKWGGGFGARWMGLNVPWGVYGIHGTNKPYSISTAASHGCIRMFNEHVKILYPYVEVGTPVKIINGPELPPGAKYRKPMKKDATGPDVVQVQLALKEQGVLLGTADGRFGSATELAVKFFQVKLGLTDTGIVDEEIYSALGIQL